MELIYIWIDEYRTFENTGINLSDKFIVEYKRDSNEIVIEYRKDRVQIYPEQIFNINIFLGKNATGKSNLLDLIGMRISDRNKLNEEFETIYKPKKKGQIGYTHKDIIEERKNSRYFLIYYLGKENGQDKFCIEGNDIESYIDIFENKDRIDNLGEYNPLLYWKEKYWFAFVCTYIKDKLIYEEDINTGGGRDEITKAYRPHLKDNFAIICFREKYNENYYGYGSFKDEDETKISIPRRISNFDSKYLYKKIEFLIKQLNYSNRKIYLNSTYTLVIECNEADIEEDDIIDIRKEELRINKEEEAICKILSSFCFYFFRSVFYTDLKINEQGKMYVEKLRKKQITLEIRYASYKEINDYYRKLIIDMTSFFFNQDEDYKTNIDHFIGVYDRLVDNLEQCFMNHKKKDITIDLIQDKIKIEINKNTDKELIKQFILATIDEKIESNNKEIYSVFNGFFEFRILNLSDGESAYLGIMSSINEQIGLLTEKNICKKNQYILLFDEVENRLHPELARNFIKYLIEFLGQYEDKRFHLIFASHSPFLVSDIPREGVITLAKENGDLITQVSKSQIDTFGQNIHSLLRSNFFMDNTIGAYAQHRINQVKQFLEGITTEVNLTFEDAEKIINLIGEDILKRALQAKLDHYRKDKQSTQVNEVIDVYNKLSSIDQRVFIEYIIQSNTERSTK